MAAVILFEFPADKAAARSWILDHAAILAITGAAELKFVGTEQAGSGRETIAIEFESIGGARSTLSEWRRDEGFPACVEARLLQTEEVPLADVIFP
jgi:hypothetical protein